MTKAERDRERYTPRRYLLREMTQRKKERKKERKRERKKGVRVKDLEKINREVERVGKRVPD